MHVLAVEGEQECEEIVDVHRARSFLREIVASEDLLDLLAHVKVTRQCLQGHIENGSTCVREGQVPLTVFLTLQIAR